MIVDTWQDIDVYYEAAMHDLQHGLTSIKGMQIRLLEVEEFELYYACEGIKRAIEDYKKQING